MTLHPPPGTSIGSAWLHPLTGDGRQARGEAQPAASHPSSRLIQARLAWLLSYIAFFAAMCLT